MSRCSCRREVALTPAPIAVQPFVGRGVANCICDFPTLVILILIVLQFSRRKHDEGYGDDCKGHGPIGNGVLFIIALFFLSCAGCGRGAY